MGKDVINNIENKEKMEEEKVINNTKNKKEEKQNNQFKGKRTWQRKRNENKEMIEENETDENKKIEVSGRTSENIEIDSMNEGVSYITVSSDEDESKFYKEALEEYKEMEDEGVFDSENDYELEYEYEYSEYEESEENEDEMKMEICRSFEASSSSGEVESEVDQEIEELYWAWYDKKRKYYKEKYKNPKTEKFPLNLSDADLVELIPNADLLEICINLVDPDIKTKLEGRWKKAMQKASYLSFWSEMNGTSEYN